MRLYTLITLLFCYVNLIVSAPADSASISDYSHQRLSGRSPKYDFGLGKRRINPYSFGLGKRSCGWDYDETYNVPDRVEAYENGLDMPMDFDMERAVYEPKRARPYSFGLGKRARVYDFGLGRR